MRSSVAPRASQNPKGRGHDSDEEDDGKMSAEEENEMNRIMGRNQPPPQKKKGALSLAERAQQRVLLSQGLPAAPKAVLKEMLNTPTSATPRLSSRPASPSTASPGPRSSSLAPSPQTSRPPSPSPQDEESKRRKEEEEKQKAEAAEKQKQEEEKLKAEAAEKQKQEEELKKQAEQKEKEEQEKEARKRQEAQEQEEKERKEKEAAEQKTIQQQPQVANKPPPQPATEKPQVVFVLGGPGAGKGTQCVNIVREFGFVHLSAGDLLRDERKQGGETGTLIEKYIVEGKIVPVEITVGLLKKAMEKFLQVGKYKFLVDGFPRNHENLLGWEKVMSDFATVRLVLFFECSEKVMLQRLLKRGETSGRSDDNVESIKKRFKTFLTETTPVMESFFSKGMARNIDGEATEKEVFDDVMRMMGAKFERISESSKETQENAPASGTEEGKLKAEAAEKQKQEAELKKQAEQKEQEAREKATREQQQVANKPPPKPATEKPQVVFVLGGPGAGKGTQCANIVREFGFVHLSAGDLLRDERKQGGETGTLIEKYIVEGKIVPVEITVGLIKKAMEKFLQVGKYKFLVDGFPRNNENLLGWDQVMSDFASVRLVLFFECSEKIMLQRLLKRGETSGRSDDNVETIKKRFKTFLTETTPVMESFFKKGMARTVDGEGTESEVFEDVMRYMGSKFDRVGSEETHEDAPVTVTADAPSAPPLEDGPAPMDDGAPVPPPLEEELPSTADIPEAPPLEDDIPVAPPLEEEIEYCPMDDTAPPPPPLEDDTPVHMEVAPPMAPPLEEETTPQQATEEKEPVKKPEVERLVSMDRAPPVAPPLAEEEPVKKPEVERLVSMDKAPPVAPPLAAEEEPAKVTNPKPETAEHSKPEVERMVSMDKSPPVAPVLEEEKSRTEAEKQPSTPEIAKRESIQTEQSPFPMVIITTEAKKEDSTITKPYDVVHTGTKKTKVKNIDGKKALAIPKAAPVEPDLIKAARENNWELVKSLISKSADVNAVDTSGRPALNFAIRAKELDVIKLLHESKASSTSIDQHGNSALHLAASSGNSQLVKFFLTEAKVEIDSVDKEHKRTPLQVATRIGSFELMQLLLEHKANLFHLDKFRNSLVHVAVTRTPKASQAEIVNFLSTQRISLDTEDKYHQTPLHLAVREGNLPMVTLLLKNKANLHVADHDGSTPLLHAASLKKWDVVKYLVESGAHVNDALQKGTTALNFAAQWAEVDLVKFLIAKGAHLLYSDKSGATALHAAAKEGRGDVVKLLLDHRADLSHADRNKRTAMFWACKTNRLEAAKVLLEQKANVEIIGVDGISILLQMALSDAWDTFKLVLPQIRSSLDAFDKHRRTALLVAARAGEVQVVKLLLGRRANIYHADANGRTALHWAVAANKLEVVRLLLEELADPSAMDREKASPLHFACSTWEPRRPRAEARNKTREDIIKLLIVNNANVGQHPDILLHACAKRRWDLVRKLISLKADISATDKKGHTLAAYAIASRQWDLVNVVIESKSINHPINHWGERLLQLSATHGQTAIVKKLLESRADIDATDNSGWSALQSATAAGESEIVKMLTEAGAKVSPAAPFTADTFVNSWSLFVCDPNERFNGPSGTLVALNRFLPAGIAEIVIEYMIVEISLPESSTFPTSVSSQCEFLAIFKWKNKWPPGFPRSFLHAKATQYVASTEMSLVRSATHKVVTCSKRVESVSFADLTLDVGGRLRLIPKNGVSTGDYELTIASRSQKEAGHRVTKKINVQVTKTDSPTVTPKQVRFVSHKAQKRASKMLNKNQFGFS